MCEDCVKKGIMTQEQFDNEAATSGAISDLIGSIELIMHSQTEFIQMNVYINCIVRATMILGLNPFSVLHSLQDSFAQIIMQQTLDNVKIHQHFKQEESTDETVDEKKVVDFKHRN